MAPKGHSKFGASKMSRILACPGSANLEEKFPDRKSADAQTGSVAHRVGEKCILNKNNADAYIGTDVLMEDGSIGKCDKEMADAVQVYVDEIRRWEKELPSAIVHVEVEGSLDWIDKDVWGTNDCAIRQFMGTLVVLDYKHGAGVPVDVVKDDRSINPQLMQYALQALGKPPKNGVENYETVVVGIVQPRSFHPDGPVRYAPEMTPQQVREWGDTVLKAGVKAAKKRNAPLNPGEHCRFCKAAQGCPAIHAQANSAALEAFGGDVDSGKPLDPVVMTPVQVAKVLSFEKILVSWLKSVKERAFSMLTGGEPVPGFKLVKKKTHRKWLDPGAVESALIQAGVDADSILSQRSLLSPSQIEKVCKASGITFDVNSASEAPSAGSIALESDKRPAWVPTSADEMFSEIESEE